MHSLLSRDVYMTYTCTLVDGEIHGVQREPSYNFVHNLIDFFVQMPEFFLNRARIQNYFLDWLSSAVSPNYKTITWSAVPVNNGRK